MAEKRAFGGVFHEIAQSGLLGNIGAQTSGFSGLLSKSAICIVHSVGLLMEIFTHELVEEIIAHVQYLLGYGSFPLQNTCYYIDQKKF